MPFQPTDISNCFIWIRADTGTYQDAAKAVPCTNGTGVYTWDNFGSDPSDFVQSSGGSQPIYNSVGSWPPVGGIPSVTFSSTNVMASTTASQGAGVPLTIFCVARLTNPSATGVLLGANAGANMQVANAAGGTTGYLYRGGGPASSFGPWSTTRPTIVSIILDGSSPFCYAWLNQSQIASPNGVNNGNAAIASISLGAIPGFPFNGEYYEVIVYNKKLSDAERLQVLAYLEGRFTPYPTSATIGISTIQSATWMAFNRPLKGFLLGMQERHQVNTQKNDSDGDVDPPCFSMNVPGVWRFRWGVEAGSRSISVNTKQVSNVTGQRPRMTVLANPAIGVAETSVDASSSTGWVTLGPINITPSANGVLWVEFHNLDLDNQLPDTSPAFFDDVSTS